jgi:hypothetical protein
MRRRAFLITLDGRLAAGVAVSALLDPVAADAQQPARVPDRSHVLGSLDEKQ